MLLYKKNLIPVWRCNHLRLYINHVFNWNHWKI